MKKRYFKVNGMGCAVCSGKVEKAVRALPGIQECAVNLLGASMIVVGDASSAAIIEAVKKVGYEAIADEEAEEGRSGGMVSQRKDAPCRMLISMVLLSILCYVSMGHVMHGWPLPLPAFLSVGLLEAALSLAVLLLNFRYFTGAISAISHGAPNMDVLVSMGASVAFGYSVFLQISGASPHLLYYESAAMIPALVSIGKWLEERAKGKTTTAIVALAALAPKTARVIRDGVEVEIPNGEIVLGDIFVVRAGDGIPADGEVVSGNGMLDESMLTGESRPAEKHEASRVSAGTFIVSGELRCRAVGVGADTTLAQIIRLVEEASASKAPIARTADRIAAVFVPFIICIAAVTVAVWLLLGATMAFALSCGISVLVVSCPCAMGLATPVAIIVGNGIAARNGILFKTAAALEMAGRISTVAFDKTGTLTEICLPKHQPVVPGTPEHLRSDSPTAVKTLGKMGLKTVLISGDRPEIATDIGAKVGISELHAGVLPGDKSKIVGDLKAKGKVAMVGDGINDAPALTLADLGIAIGAGTDVAINAAEVVLVKNSPLDVVKTIRIGRGVLAVVRQNLFWAFAYNIIGIPLAAGLFYPIFGWHLTPAFGAAAMSLSSIIVVLNSLRLNIKRF